MNASAPSLLDWVLVLGSLAIVFAMPVVIIAVWVWFLSKFK